MLGHDSPNGLDILDIDQCEYDIFVCTTPTVVHELFYRLLKMNLLYNKNVRADNNRIIQFDINNMTIQENTDYREVASTNETLNRNIVSGEDKYIYIMVNQYIDWRLSIMNVITTRNTIQKCHRKLRIYSMLTHQGTLRLILHLKMCRRQTDMILTNYTLQF